VVVQLPKHKENQRKKAEMPITETVLCGEMGMHPSTVTITEQPAGKLGGEVIITEHSGEQFQRGIVGSQSGCAQAADEPGEGKTSSERAGGSSVATDRLYIDSTPTVGIQALFDEADAKKAQGKRVTVTGNESFSRVCKTMGLPFELHNRFSEWLIDCQGFSAEVLGLGSYNKVRNGLTIPYPTGHKWKKVMEAGSRKQRRAAHMDCEPNEDATNSAVEWIQSQISSQNAEVQKGGKYAFNIQRSRETICNNIVARKQGDVQAVKKKRTKAVATGHEPAPRNVKESLYGTEAETWAKSMGAEFNPLVEKGVLDLGYTKADLLKEGIDGRETSSTMWNLPRVKIRFEW